MPEACQVSTQNRMSARSRLGPGHSPARAGGDAAHVGGDTAVLEERPRSPRTALLPQSITGAGPAPRRRALTPRTKRRASQPQTVGLRTKLCPLKAGSEETSV